MDKKQKVLIIKTGYSEVLDNGDNLQKVSYGDILRTTPLLHLYKNDLVTWVSDESVFPLLKGNVYLDRLLPLDFTTTMHLLDEEFDTLINLEKNNDICKLSNKVDAWRKYGFRFDKENKKAEAYDRAHDVLAVSVDKVLKRENQKTFQELLFEMVGEKWNGEAYVLGYKPSSEANIYDVGFNSKVGPKWPIKAWPMENWDKLESLLVNSNNFRITRQEKQSDKVLKNLFGYMDWINSCKTIITSDTLGMHLGMALNKKVLGLFGPTPYKEVYFYGKGKAILPEPIPDCLPCFKETCERGKNCMQDISPTRIYKEIMNL